MAAVTESFYKSLTIVAAVFVAGFFVNQNLVSTMEKITEPLVQRILAIEQTQAANADKFASLSYDVKVNELNLNSLMAFVNKGSNREFVKPDEVPFRTKKYGRNN